MRSKAQFKTHPLHPILVAFPIAFFTGTLLAHVAGWLFNEPSLLLTAYYLNAGGVVFGLIAAIPGFIDYLFAVPPKSSGKKRAALHGIINAGMLLIFVSAFFYRRNVDANDYILIAIELSGVILMGIAGWMGGTLVYRNQIGVDHRYANAGKWNEQYFSEASGEIQVASADELKVNAMKLLHFKNKRIVLARTEEQYFAFDDRCPHRGGSLADGSLICGTVQCPWHGSQFKIDTGELKNGPAKESIKTYLVKEKDRNIMLVF